MENEYVFNVNSHGFVKSLPADISISDPKCAHHDTYRTQTHNLRLDCGVILPNKEPKVKMFLVCS